MKLTLGFLLFTTLFAFGQDVSDCTITIGNSTVPAITTSLKEYAVDSLVKRLRKDLGPERENNAMGVTWNKVSKPNLATGKLTLQLTMLREGSDFNVVISCFNSKGKTLLTPGSDSQVKIKKYFEDMLRN